MLYVKQLAYEDRLPILNISRFINDIDIVNGEYCYVLYHDKICVAWVIVDPKPNNGAYIWKIEVFEDHRRLAYAEKLTLLILHDFDWISVMCINHISLKTIFRVAQQTIKRIDIAAYVSDLMIVCPPHLEHVHIRLIEHTQLRGNYQMKIENGHLVYSWL